MNKPKLNQKMLMSALVKDVYVEIERLKQKVRVAREKNGVYLPHDHFIQEEAEKRLWLRRLTAWNWNSTLRKIKLRCWGS